MRPTTIRAMRNLTHHKMRSATILAGLAVAVAGVAAASLTTVQLNASLDRAKATSALPDLELVTAWRAGTIAGVLRRQPNIEAVQARGYEPAVWKLARTYRRLNLIGIRDFRHLNLERIALVDGRLPGPGQILMEATDPLTQAVGVGTRIEVVTGLGIHSFTVSGLARSPGLPSSDLSGRETAYLRLHDLNGVAGSRGMNDFLIKLADVSRRTSASQSLGRSLERMGVPIFRSQSGPDSAARHVVNSLAGGMWAASVAAMILGLLVVSGGICRFVSEERIDLVSMRIMGARAAEVVKSHGVLIALFCFAGTLLGLLFGSLSADLLVRYVASQFTLDTGRLSIRGMAIGVSVATGIVLSAVAGTVALAQAARRSQRDATDADGIGPSPSRDWIFKGVRRVFGRVPLRFLLGTREVSLRKRAMVPALCVLTLSGLTFLTAQCAGASFDAATARSFSSYRVDLYVSLGRPARYEAVRQVLQSVPGVRHTEPLSQLTVTTRWGAAELTGIRSDSTLYLRRLQAGRWPAPGDRSAAVISADAAHRSGLRIGDSISFHDDLHRVSWRIVGIVPDFSGVRVGAGSLGTIVAPIQQVSAYRRWPPSLVDDVMIQSAGHSRSEVEALGREVEATLAAAGYQTDVSTANDQLDETRRESRVVSQLLYGIAGILGLAGACGISSMLSIAVDERGRDHALMRAMGATTGALTQVVWAEGVCLGLLAWIFVMVVGIPVAFAGVSVLARTLIAAPFSLSISGMLFTLPLLLIVAIIGSVRPGLAATRPQSEYASSWE